MSDWGRISRETIARVHAQLPEDAPFKERKAAVKAAYPFGERNYWPYKAWCKAQRSYLAKYDPAAPMPPAWREAIRRAGGEDITFPFAQESTK